MVLVLVKHPLIDFQAASGKVAWVMGYQDDTVLEDSSTAHKEPALPYHYFLLPYVRKWTAIA